MIILHLRSEKQLKYTHLASGDSLKLDDWKQAESLAANPLGRSGKQNSSIGNSYLNGVQSFQGKLDLSNHTSIVKRNVVPL